MENFLVPRVGVDRGKFTLLKRKNGELKQLTECFRNRT